MTTKKVTAEFYAFFTVNPENQGKLFDLLSKHTGSHAPSVSLDADDDEKYQVRSINPNRSNTVFRAVFGRCRYNEALEQASEDSDDKDIQLLPGYGLVEKNHFLFYKATDLIVFQANSNASRIGKLQRYLSRVLNVALTLEAVLAEDNYEKLINAGPLKRIELSIKLPKFKPDQADEFLYESIASFQKEKAGRVNIVLSPDRGATLAESLRLPLVNIARAGLATVARAKTIKENIDEDADQKHEVIDLIMGKIKKTFDAALDEKNKVEIKSLYAGLAQAKDDCNEDLKKFFA